MVILTSAVDRGVVRTLIWFKVEISYGGTVSDVVVNIIHHVRLGASGEGSHLLRDLLSRMPDHTLDVTLASANGEVINLSGRGLELHGVFP